MIQSRFFKKVLTPAEVGDTGTHEKYIRLTNDFDFEEFFQTPGRMNGNVRQIDFEATDLSTGHENETLAFKFVFYENSNSEKRIPSLSPLYDSRNVQAGDIIVLESRTENAQTCFFFTLYKAGELIIKPSTIYYTDIVTKTIKSNSNIQSVALQQIFYGAPGTGKSNTIKHEVEDNCHIHFRTTFHPDSDYSTFVGCYKPTMRSIKKTVVIGQDEKEVKPLVGESNAVEQISYQFVPQDFTKAYCEAWNQYNDNESTKPVYLIIEEINRGNCAQIFGDIFQLLDRETEGQRCGYSTYPIDADEDLKKFLLTGKKEDGTEWLVNKDGIKNGKLCLPPNLYIWATMNTSDQSLFPIDSAFKRRWEWKYIPIDTEKEKWSISINGKSYSWSSFLKRINEEIDDTTHSEDKKLGFYFCKAINGVISADRFVGKALFYLYNDVFKDYNLSRQFLKDAGGKTLAFQSFFNSIDGSINENAVEIILKNLNVDLTGNAADADPQIDSEESTADALLDEDGNTPAMQTNDLSKYAINGAGAFGKGSVAYEVMKLYIAKHPQKTALEVANDWLALGVEKVPNFFETETMHETRRQKATDVRFDKRSESVTLADGQKIYVSNQYTQERIDEVMAKINAANWGITISKL